MTEPSTPAMIPVLLPVTRHMASVLRRVVRAEARQSPAMTQLRWEAVERVLTSVIDRDTVSLDKLFSLEDETVLIDANHILWQVWPQVDGEVWLAPFGSANVFQIFRDPTNALGYRTHAQEVETVPSLPVRVLGALA